MNNWRQILSWKPKPEIGYGWLYETHYKNEDYVKYLVCVALIDGLLWGPPLQRTEGGAIALYRGLTPVACQYPDSNYYHLTYINTKETRFTVKPIRYIGPLPFEIDHSEIQPDSP
jgi:hypothetical protein